MRARRKMAALRVAGAALLRPGRGAAAAAGVGYHKKVRGGGEGCEEPIVAVGDC